ncbi:izumo sperm-egg fusion protein 2-like [Liasis olivaceus]
MLLLGFSSVLFLIWFPARIWSCLHCDPVFKSNMAKLQTDIVSKKIRDTRLKTRAKVLLSGLEGDFFLHYATSQFSGLAGIIIIGLDLSLVGRAELNGTIKSMIDALIQEVRLTTGKLLQTQLTDEALLEELVAFRRETTMKLKRALKEYQVQGIASFLISASCDEKICAALPPLQELGLGQVGHPELVFPCLVILQVNFSRFLSLPSLAHPPPVAVALKYEVFNCRRCLPTAAYCLSLSQCFVDSQERLALRFGQPLVDPDIARNGVAIVLCMGGVLFLVIIGVIIVYWRSQLYKYV